MAAADAEAIESGTPAAVLMERAGRAVARAAIRVAGGRYGRSAVVVCGKGKNGGDGFVAARVLAGEGMSVRCVALERDSGDHGAAAEHRRSMERRGVLAEPFTGRLPRAASVVVDAVFGTGAAPLSASVSATGGWPAGVSAAAAGAPR